jgi:hypothetical protein
MGGAPLLANTRGGESTVIEGTGRFVGDPPTGAISPSSDDVTGGVTINLVNVPAPQAATNRTFSLAALCIWRSGHRGASSKIEGAAALSRGPIPVAPRLKPSRHGV